MIEISDKQKLDAVMEKIRATSFSEKQNQKTEEELMNSFLDAINVIKKDLVTRTETIIDISERMEEVTWFNNLDQSTVQILNELIVLARDVHSSLIRNYVGLNIFRQKGVAKNEITEFKNAIDFLKDVIDDLEFAFFSFPKDKEFQKVTAALEELL